MFVISIFNIVLCLIFSIKNFKNIGVGILSLCITIASIVAIIGLFRFSYYIYYHFAKCYGNIEDCRAKFNRLGTLESFYDVIDCSKAYEKLKSVIRVLDWGSYLITCFTLKTVIGLL